jgi:hypothetical protein
MASTIKLNYDRKALASVINYDRKCDATIWLIPTIIIYSCKTFIVQAMISDSRLGRFLFSFNNEGCVCIKRFQASTEKF